MSERELELRKEMKKLNEDQSTGFAPELYPENNTKRSIICPSCKGKGWKRDWIGVIFTFGMGPLVDQNDRPQDGSHICISKQICSQCKGEEFIEIGRGRGR